ncbi:uncharacterized protein LOC111306495 [Durio zibethinus]|uniref:Uncharacterized protein LOC111306495 n=1 Tax=Durio zibethinus TaxID=66656 RepID=A0A6P6A5S3_DURZI|nr:uncharacterized protein LOC111306495 [Durio zibethinus]
MNILPEDHFRLKLSELKDIGLQWTYRLLIFGFKPDFLDIIKKNSGLFKVMTPLNFNHLNLSLPLPMSEKTSANTDVCFWFTPFGFGWNQGYIGLGFLGERSEKARVIAKKQKARKLRKQQQRKHERRRKGLDFINF